MNKETIINELTNLKDKVDSDFTQKIDSCPAHQIDFFEKIAVNKILTIDEVIGLVNLYL